MLWKCGFYSWVFDLELKKICRCELVQTLCGCYLWMHSTIQHDYKINWCTCIFWRSPSWKNGRERLKYTHADFEFPNVWTIPQCLHDICWHIRAHLVRLNVPEACQGRFCDDRISDFFASLSSECHHENAVSPVAMLHHHSTRLCHKYRPQKMRINSHLQIFFYSRSNTQL